MEMVKLFSAGIGFRFWKETAKWAVCYGFLLLGLSLWPTVSEGANWSVDLGPGNNFVSRSSLNPADIGTNNITIGAGDTVTWTWVDPSPHSSTQICSDSQTLNSPRFAGFRL